MRADSTMCAEFVATKDSHDLVDVLRTMTHMHFLHAHTGGEYRRAVNEAVRSYAEDAGCYFEGIHRMAAKEVQCEERFALPPCLPWLPAQLCSTEAALDGAVRRARATLSAAMGERIACRR